MTTTTTPTPFTRTQATPVCDRCATVHSTGAWRALADGMQICQTCWQDVMCPADPPVLRLPHQLRCA